MYWGAAWKALSNKGRAQDMGKEGKAAGGSVAVVGYYGTAMEMARIVQHAGAATGIRCYAGYCGRTGLWFSQSYRKKISRD